MSTNETGVEHILDFADTVEASTTEHWTQVLKDESHPWYRTLFDISIRAIVEFEEQFGDFQDPLERAEQLIARSADYKSVDDPFEIGPYVWSSADITRAYGIVMDTTCSVAAVSGDHEEVVRATYDEIAFLNDYLEWLQSASGHIADTYAWNDEKLIEQLESQVVFSDLSPEDTLRLLMASPNTDISNLAQRVSPRSLTVVNSISCREMKINNNLQTVNKQVSGSVAEHTVTTDLGYKKIMYENIGVKK